jgi:hypothetical protein
VAEGMERLPEEAEIENKLKNLYRTKRNTVSLIIWKRTIRWRQ